MPSVNAAYKTVWLSTVSTTHLPRRPQHSDYDVLITAPNDRVDRKNRIRVTAPTSRTFHYRDDRDNADIRTGRRRPLFEVLRRSLIVDN